MVLEWRPGSNAGCSCTRRLRQHVEHDAVLEQAPLALVPRSGSFVSTMTGSPFRVPVSAMSRSTS
jgi:hypothetical protein